MFLLLKCIHGGGVSHSEEEIGSPASFNANTGNLTIEDCTFCGSKALPWWSGCFSNLTVCLLLSLLTAPQPLTLLAVTQADETHLCQCRGLFELAALPPGVPVTWLTPSPSSSLDVRRLPKTIFTLALLTSCNAVLFFPRSNYTTGQLYHSFGYVKAIQF